MIAEPKSPVSRPSPLGALRIALILCSASLALGTTAGAAFADPHGHDRGHSRGGDYRHGGGHWGGYGGGYYPPPPVVYGAPYYAPPPVVWAPGVGVNIHIP
jgi:hypothetical protein